LHLLHSFGYSQASRPRSGPRHSKRCYTYISASLTMEILGTQKKSAECDFSHTAVSISSTGHEDLDRTRTTFRKVGPLETSIDTAETELSE